MMAAKQASLRMHKTRVDDYERGSHATRELQEVVQRLDNSINRINHYPVDKCYANKPRYPADSDLSSG